MRMRWLLPLLLVVTAAHAQLPGTSQTIDVNVVEVDVDILDAQGKPVPGLERKDFDLRVGGHKRSITNFYAVNRRADDSGAIATPSNQVARRDYLVLFVDDLHLNQHEKKRALDGLRKFVTEHVRGGTAAMLVAFDGNVRILQKFTEDASALTREIDALQRRPAHVSDYESQRRELLNLMDEIRREPRLKKQLSEQLPTMMDSLAEQGTIAAVRTIGALDSVVNLASGLDGRRVLVYVSDGLPQQPGVEVFHSFNQDDFAPGDSSLSAYRVISQSVPLDAMKHDLGVPLQKLARTSALAGVQFFSIDARGVQGFDETTPDAPVTSSRLDSSLIRNNLVGPLELLAQETGGQAITDTNDMNVAFDKLEEHLSSYYSLGFVSQGTDHEDDVSVSVKRRGLTVHATKHVRQRTAREEIADRVRSALYARTESNPLDARVAIVQAGTGVKATIRVPTSKLSIYPGAQSSFVVFVAMLDEQMRETPVRMFVHRIGSAEIQESMQTLTLDVPPGTYTVSLAVSDSYSLQVSYMQQDLTVTAAQ
jgi:VWFA-related protein